MGKKKILNLTQHPASEEQKNAGVIEPTNKEKVKELLTFNELPTQSEITARAAALTAIALDRALDGEIEVMIGGAPFLMSTLEKALQYTGITPVYAFSKRESKEEKLPDGSVKKINVFKHVGFVGK